MDQVRKRDLPPGFSSSSSSCLLRVLGLQFAGHVEQKVLVVNDLELSDVGLGLQV